MALVQLPETNKTTARASKNNDEIYDPVPVIAGMMSCFDKEETPERI